LSTSDASLIEVRAQDLRAGLFVAALDRPWQETPFLLQGFLAGQDDIAQIQQLCKAVYIDPRRSNVEVLRMVSSSASAALDARTATGARPVQQDASFVIYGHAAQKTSLVQEIKQDLKLPGRQVHVGAPSNAAALGPPTLAAPDLSAVAGGVSRLWMRMRKGWHDLLNPVDGKPKPLPKSKNPKFVDADEALTRYPPAPPINAEALEEARRKITDVQAAVNRLYADVDLQSELQLEELEDSMAELVNTVLTDPNAALWMARMRDYDAGTFARSLKTAVFLMTFGRHIGYSRDGLLKLGMTGMLLDIGKIRVSKEVLETKGELSQTQWQEAQSHVQRGIELLESERRLDPDVKLAILHHHERADGSGYPQGLPDEKISTFGRMAGIVDTVTAMISARPYAETVSTYDALREVMATGGHLFNAAMLEQFVQAIGVFPIGSLVELSTGEVAAVTGHNPIRRLEPRVLVLTQTDKTPVRAPFERDLLYRPTDATGKTIYILRGLPAGAYGVDPRKYYLD
jgi:HD-GYP domain-containing protein (c-di-GMP phosphodiesterase class II)